MPLFLANRGSSGYGRAFMEAAKGEFAGKMHTDLLDGIDHLVAQGVTDPHKVAIMGTRYGGYASMVAQCLGGRSSGFDFYQLGSWAL